MQHPPVRCRRTFSHSAEIHSHAELGTPLPRSGFVLLATLVVGVFLSLSALEAQQSLDIEGATTISAGQSADFTVHVTNDSPIQGYVLAIEYDPGLIEITEMSSEGTITEASEAELMVMEILLSGFTYGAVLDAGPPFDSQEIPVGVDQLILTFTARAIPPGPGPGDPDVVTGFSFLNGVLNNPPLSNILVQGGQSIGEAQGLALNSAPAALTITQPPPVEFRIPDATFLDGEGCAQVLMSNMAGPTEGFVLAIEHDPAVLTLLDINLTGTATDLAMPEFVIESVLATGGTLGVAFDIAPPFDAQTIPVGDDLLIANFCYGCTNPDVIFEGAPPPPDQVTTVSFVNGVLANPGMNSPPLDNIVVVGGASLNPDLVPGTIRCAPIVVPQSDTKFYCGPRSIQFSFDPDEPIPPIEGAVGETVEICFHYSDPTDNLQGLQIAVCHDCNLIFESFSIEDSIFEAVGAEFSTHSIDNNPNDGDGCEFVVGILLDALPPFDMQTVPSTATPLMIGCAQVTIGPLAPCGFDLPLEFCDSIDGNGMAPIANIVIANFESIQGFEKEACVISVEELELFRRGDCNVDETLDLADAISVINWLFEGVPILCPDACDANDDGTLNLADSITLTNYLFSMGPPPPDPGPIDPGPDPTDDDLESCFTGMSTCVSS